MNPSFSSFFRNSQEAKEYLKASFLFMLFLEESRGNSFCKS
jgi:hypothetical protein